MKLRKTKLVVFFLAIAGVVAWSPPNGEDISMGSNNSLDTPSGIVAVFGNTNTLKGYSSLVVGNSNAGGGNNYANTSLISGNSNSIWGATVGSPSWHSAAIGLSNQIMASPGWTVGEMNEVAANSAMALGKGLEVPSANPNTVALGRWNAAMNAEDVVVVGSGTADTTRATALRVTNDGGVFLGRAQGDVSMGEYSN